MSYARDKLQAAEKQLAIQTAAGDLEKAEHLKEAVKDWQARYAAAKAELDAIEKPLPPATPSPGTPPPVTPPPVTPPPGTPMPTASPQPHAP